MSNRIILWSPENINFEELFSPSNQFPDGDFSKSKMLIILNLLKPSFNGGMANLKFPSLLKKELKVDVVKYVAHLQSKGIVDFEDKYSISENSDGATFRLNPIYQSGKYWNFFVSKSAETGFNKLLARLKEHPRKNGLSKKHDDWLCVPYNALTSFKTIIPHPLNN